MQQNTALSRIAVLEAEVAQLKKKLAEARQARDDIRAGMGRAMAEMTRLEQQLAEARAAIENAPHDLYCMYGKPTGVMVGGISLDVNVRPNNHEALGMCNCWKRAALETPK